MMKLAALLGATSALAAPSRVLSGRQAASSPLCGDQQTSDTSQAYYVNNNLWGRDGVDGTQCTTINSLSNTGIAWQSQWTWLTGAPTGWPISFPYSEVPLTQAQKLPISQLKSMPTNVTWSYDQSNIKADVAYDLFTAANPAPGGYSGTGDFEIMLWLSSWGGVNPKGQQIDTFTYNNIPYTLWYGADSNSKTYSYVANTPATSFNGDLAPFVQHLITCPQPLDGNQALITFQFGSEIWSAPQQTTFSVTNFDGAVQY